MMMMTATERKIPGTVLTRKVKVGMTRIVVGIDEDADQKPKMDQEIWRCIFFLSEKIKQYVFCHQLPLLYVG